MKPLPILWQRLVADGKTCDRCSATYQEMQRAMEKLTRSLQPLGIEPRLEIREIDQQTFKANPLRVEPHLDRGKAHRGVGRCNCGKQSLLLGLRHI